MDREFSAVIEKDEDGYFVASVPLRLIAAVSGNILRKCIRIEKFPAAKDPCWMATTSRIAQWVEGKVGA